jgi:hypothetical protein
MIPAMATVESAKFVEFFNEFSRYESYSFQENKHDLVLLVAAWYGIRAALLGINRQFETGIGAFPPGF